MRGRLVAAFAAMKAGVGKLAARFARRPAAMPAEATAPTAKAAKGAPRPNRPPLPGRGNAAAKRAARKRRNVERNRLAQRGFVLLDGDQVASWVERQPPHVLVRIVLELVVGFWLLVLLAFCAPAGAAERCLVGAVVGSFHLDPNREDQLTNATPGAYVLCERWSAGAYRDSRRRPAAFAGFAMQREGLALVVGTKATRDGIEPIVIGSIRMGPVRALVTPPLGRTPAALALALEF